MAKKEYIEREALMNEFAETVKDSNNSDFVPTATWNRAVYIVERFPAADVIPKTLESAIDYLREIGWLQQHDRELMEAADAESVRHGGPEPYGPPVPGEKDKFFVRGYRCPFCGDKGIKNFCPNCGAKMDGGNHA